MPSVQFNPEVNPVRKKIKIFRLLLNPFPPKRQILDSSKLKEFTEDNSKFDENARKFFKRVENIVV